MKLESAFVAKMHAKGRVTSRQSSPREGTKLRRMYDLLMASKGLPLDTPLAMFGMTAESRSNNAGIYIENLRNFYGLDIRKLEPGRWVLAGEWFGKVYIDYIAERIHAAETHAPSSQAQHERCA